MDIACAVQNNYCVSTCNEPLIKVINQQKKYGRGGGCGVGGGGLNSGNYGTSKRSLGARCT